MNILVLVDREWPCNHSFIEEVLAKELPTRGHQICILMRTRDRCLAGEHVWHSTKVIALQSKCRLKLELVFLRQLRSLILSGNWDIILIRNIALAGTYASLFDIPLVYQISHLKEESIFLAFGRDRTLSMLFRCSLALVSRWFRNYAIGHSALVLPVSDVLRDMLREKAKRSIRMCSIPLGAEPDLSPANAVDRIDTRREMGVDKDAIVFIYAGTFNRIRKLSTVIDAFELLLEEVAINAELVFVGGGPAVKDKQTLQARVASSKAGGRIHILSKVPREILYRYISASDFGVSYFPCIDFFNQNSPIKVMEYLALGKPVVCTPQPEQEFLVSATAGGIVSSGDSALQFMCAMKSVMQKSWDSASISEELKKRRGYDVISDRLSNALGDIFENRCSA